MRERGKKTRERRETDKAKVLPLFSNLYCFIFWAVEMYVYWRNKGCLYPSCLWILRVVFLLRLCCPENDSLLDNSDIIAELFWRPVFVSVRLYREDEAFYEADLKTLQCGSASDTHKTKLSNIKFFSLACLGILSVYLCFFLSLSHILYSLSLSFALSASLLCC